MKYTVEGNNPHQQFFRITYECEVQEDHIVLTFPNWRPGRYQLGNFTKNIRDFKVLGDDNKACDFEKIELNRWKIDTSNTRNITVSYLYYAQELNAGSTFLSNEMWYMNPVNCCIYNEEKIDQPCTLELKNLPKDFEIASSAQFKNYQADFRSYHHLADTPFIASASLQHQKYVSNGINFHIWINGSLKVDWDRLIDDFQKFTDHQIQEFTEFPGKEFHFLIHILPYSTYHGVEHLESTVITLGPTYQIFKDLYKELLGVSSHELYHCWNVKTIRPKEWMPYNYAIETPSRMGYLAEGVTTYMGDLELMRSKVFDFEQYKAELETQINKHLHNYGRFNHAVSDSSYDTWLDGYELGIPHRKVSIYTEGCLLAFYTDVWIMKKTDNKKGLQEVMRRLNFDFGTKGIGVTEEDYKKTIESVAESDFTEIWEQYFYGTGSYEVLITEALDYLGIEIEQQPNKSWVKRHLGILGIDNKSHFKCKRIAPGSRADLAGVSEDDEIIAINGFKINGDLEQWLEYFQDDEIQLQISRKSQIIQLTCPHIDKPYYSEAKLKRCEKPDKNQEIAFGRWTRLTKNYM